MSLFDVTTMVPKGNPLLVAVTIGSSGGRLASRAASRFRYMAKPFFSFGGISSKTWSIRCTACLHIPFQAVQDEACRHWFGVRSCGQEGVEDQSPLAC